MNVRFDPFEALERTTHSENANLNSGPAKAANPAKVPPTLATLATLAGGKSESDAENVAFAQHSSAEWTAQDWLDHFQERAAIIEHNGEQRREEAERLALADTVNQWLFEHPPEATDDAAGCVHCGVVLDDAAILVLAGDSGHTWLHGRCHHDWLAERRRHAAEALSKMGIEAASGFLR